jgi:SOS-response transcriptional repressor LexA
VFCQVAEKRGQPPVTAHSAMFSILAIEIPGQAPSNAGVLLEDPSTDHLYIRMRRDWDAFAPSEAEVLSQLESDLSAKAKEVGAARLMGLIEDWLSNTVRVTARQAVDVDDFERTLARLYREHVRSNVNKFVTHLPCYSLAVAAGKFLENQELTEEAWEEAPGDLKVTPEMFVARIAGRSMEPRILDGSLCVFRSGVVGSRQGRLVLVERVGGGTNDRYTVKRYRSEKAESAGGEQENAWSHARITLESLNPEFESWDLDPEEDRYRILAEFVRVLD